MYSNASLVLHHSQLQFLSEQIIAAFVQRLDMRLDTVNILAKCKNPFDQLPFTNVLRSEKTISPPAILGLHTFENTIESTFDLSTIYILE